MPIKDEVKETDNQDHEYEPADATPEKVAPIGIHLVQLRSYYGVLLSLPHAYVVSATSRLSGIPRGNMRQRPANSPWAIHRVLRIVVALGDSIGNRRPPSESEMSFATRFARVSSLRALTTHQVVARRYDGG